MSSESVANLIVKHMFILFIYTWVTDNVTNVQEQVQFTDKRFIRKAVMSS